MPDGEGLTRGNAPVRVTVLGATGSIGKSVADLIARNADRFEVVALVANRNVAALADMAVQLKAQSAVTADNACYEDLSERLANTGVKASAGETAVLEAVDRPTDIVVGAIVGSAGLKPTLAAIRSGRRIALANKECLVCAGDLFMEKIHQTGAELLPVDSEHNAIFQVFDDAQADQVEQIILTASGGPFRTLSKEGMASVTPQQALKHPNWDMGARISIDSATMMNKGFEVIEASHLFPVSHDQLGVLVHPQSAVHGLVQYKDGSLLAQLGSPDMRTPIAHCLGFPDRMETPVERLDLAKLASLTFEDPDLDRFPALRLALEAMKEGGATTNILNAADEVAVEGFLSGRIKFLEIADAIAAALEQLAGKSICCDAYSVDDVLTLDAETRTVTRNWIGKRTGS